MGMINVDYCKYAAQLYMNSRRSGGNLDGLRIAYPPKDIMTAADIMARPLEPGLIRIPRLFDDSHTAYIYGVEDRLNVCGPALGSAVILAVTLSNYPQLFDLPLIAHVRMAANQFLARNNMRTRYDEVANRGRWNGYGDEWTGRNGDRLNDILMDKIRTLSGFEEYGLAHDQVNFVRLRGQRVEEDLVKKLDNTAPLPSGTKDKSKPKGYTQG